MLVTRPFESVQRRLHTTIRGVLRAHKGDFVGAREDFDRIRPHQLEAYLDELKTKDVGLIAIGNFRLTDELLAKYSLEEIQASLAVRTAKIEDLND